MPKSGRQDEPGQQQLSPDLARPLDGWQASVTSSQTASLGRSVGRPSRPSTLYTRANSTQHHLDTRVGSLARRHHQPLPTHDHTQDHRTGEILHHLHGCLLRCQWISKETRSWDTRRWDASRLHQKVESGWGAGIFVNKGDTQRAAYFQGRLPIEILKQFSSNTAFIYLLEAWVAVLAPIIFEPWLGPFYVQCCDNEAARCAVLRGV